MTAALEVESGLNDLMSVFLTIGLIEALAVSSGLGAGSTALLFLEEMGGGAVIGLIGGFALLWLFRRRHVEPSIFVPTLAVSAVLILVARPAAVMACLLPFHWTAREAAFTAWAGLRGAVPIFLTIVVLLAGLRADPERS